MGIRFLVQAGELKLHRPDGSPFRTLPEMEAEGDAAAAERDAAAAEREAAAGRAEALAARLRAPGIDPDTV